MIFRSAPCGARHRGIDPRIGATSMKKTEIKVGDEVAFNMLADAIWFTVEKIDGFVLTVREVGTDYAPQTIDKSTVARVRAAK